MRVAEPGSQPLQKGQRLPQTARTRAMPAAPHAADAQAPAPALGLGSAERAKAEAAREGLGSAEKGSGGGLDATAGAEGETGSGKQKDAGLWDVLWDEIFVFEVPQQTQSPAQVEMVVSNQAALAGRGE